MDQPNIDVLIVGAGVAGLAAARALAERGMRVQVLEARNRVGGRVWTLTGQGRTVELGAEFIHGRPPELWALVDEAGLPTTERDGTFLRAQPGGGLREDEGSAGMFAAMDDLIGDPGPDRPFTAWLAEKHLPAEQQSALVGFVEGFNAAQADRIGVLGLAAQQVAEDAIEGDRAWHVGPGYARLPEYLAATLRSLGGEVLLGRTVQRITWSTHSVQVECDGGQRFSASRCIITLPLGVLQRVNGPGALRIDPSPESVLSAAQTLAMGHVSRLTAVFRRAWWQDYPGDLDPAALQQMSFLFTPEHVPSVWWTARPEPGPAILTGWVGGPRSSALLALSAEELEQRACTVLGEVFGAEPAAVRAELVALHTHNWSADPLSLGAYSYVPAGALGAPEAMCQPVENTLFFAGEHTDTTAMWGTVHAALRSGLRAAAQVLGDWPANPS